jgi:hypothetical protein
MSTAKHGKRGTRTVAGEKPQLPSRDLADNKAVRVDTITMTLAEHDPMARSTKAAQSTLSALDGPTDLGHSSYNAEYDLP